MKRYVVLLAVSASLALTAGTTHSATDNKSYWSEEKAEAMVRAKVTIPHCFIFSPDRQCANGIYRPDGRAWLGLWPLRSSSNLLECRGVDELGATFTYSRFTCSFVLISSSALAKGRLAVYPAGARKLRWRLISIGNIYGSVPAGWYKQLNARTDRGARP